MNGSGGGEGRGGGGMQVIQSKMGSKADISVHSLDYSASYRDVCGYF